MIIYFSDRRMNILGQASTNLPEGNIVANDLKSEDVESGIASFECELPYTPKTMAEIRACAAVGNYILRKNGEETELYTIIDSEHDTKSKSFRVYAEDAGLDLLNEVVGAYQADKNYPIAFYIEKFTAESGFEIGLNELSHLSRRLSWQEEQTVTERIADVAAQFDHAEVSYDFEIEGLTVTHKYINIYASRGKDIRSELRLYKDIDRIVAKESIRELATALAATGKTPEGKDKPITLSGFRYDDGDIYVSGDRVCSRRALEQWSRYILPGAKGKQAGTGGHIVKTYSCNAASQSELFAQASAELKRCSQAEINYEVDIVKLPANVKIGDTVNIVDSNHELYLSARILKLETSIANDTHEATLGNYLIKGSGITQRLTELSQQLKDLSAGRQYYTWIVYADDAQGTGISLSPEGKRYMGIAPNRYTSEPDLSDPSVFEWVETKGEKGEAGEKGEPGQDGADGRDIAVISEEPPQDTSYLWCDISEKPSVIRRWDGETWGIVNDYTQAMDLVYTNLETAVKNGSENLMIQVNDMFYKKEDIHRFLEEVGADYAQLSDRLEFNFTQVKGSLEDFSEYTEGEFEKINKYIWFEDGGIAIGVEGNPIVLRMQNDRIGFFEGENEVAYISNRKMYIRDAEILSSLAIGKFAFIPRNNGNLSFKKMK